MTFTDCRIEMHAAERNARNAEEGNEFTLAWIERLIEAAYFAYNATREAKVANRLKAAIDRMEATL